MAKSKYTVVARIESENDRDISTWVTLGYAIPGKRDGELNIKLNTLPIFKDLWDGWIYIREREESEEREDKFKERARAKRNVEKPAKPAEDSEYPRDDIPF